MKSKLLNTKRGFSLIEVIVAMGIASTVMVGLIGIMPAGVESLHDAATTTIQARIVQDLISDAQMSDWADRPASSNTDKAYLSDLAGASNSRRYDSDGTLITTTGSGAATLASYVTLLELPTGSTAPTILSTPYKHLKKVQIAVEFTPGGRAPDFESSKHAKFIKRYSFYIANMGTNEGLK